MSSGQVRIWTKLVVILFFFFTKDFHDSSVDPLVGRRYVKHESNPGSVGRLGDGLIHASLLELAISSRWLIGEYKKRTVRPMGAIPHKSLSDKAQSVVRRALPVLVVVGGGKSPP
jgi:hypothetical protein